MTLAELINEVYIITKRPDRISETSSAIRNATLTAHQSDFFDKDIFESGVAFTSAEFVQNLDYRSLLPLWRKPKYFRKYNSTDGTPGIFLDPIVPENVLDSYNLQRQNIFYVAGAFLQINSSTEEQFYLMGVYLNPDITTVGYNSWVALDHPWFIIHKAAAIVNTALGKLDDAKLEASLAADEMLNIQRSNTSTTGF